MKQPAKRLRAFDDQLERLGIGARRNLASAGLSVRHGTWTPDTGDAGRQAPRARCSPVQHAIIIDSYAVYREDQWQRRSKHTELES